MIQLQNQNFDSNNPNHNISGKKLVTIVSIVIVIIVVAILSKKSYASILSNTNTASFFTDPSYNILEGDSNHPVNSEHSLIPDTIGLKKGIRKFHFYEKENGDQVHYKAKLKDGKITELYVDDKKIPKDELGKYESKIQDKLNEYESVLNDYKRNKDEYKKLAKEYSGKRKDLCDKLKELNAERFDFNFDFDFNGHFAFEKPDLSELHESMRELRRELRDSFADRSIVILPIHIPEIKIPQIHIPPVYFDEDEWDNWNDELKENMEELKEGMKNNNFRMKEFKEDMKEFRGKMKEFGLEIKKFGNFIKEMKNELVSDGIINSGDEIDKLLLSEDKMEVNGKSVFTELHKKYKDMYEKHTGKKIEGKNKIRINE